MILLKLYLLKDIFEFLTQRLNKNYYRNWYKKYSLIIFILIIDYNFAIILNVYPYYKNYISL